MPRRYTIVIADRQTGAIRRFTARLRPVGLATAAVVVLPILIGFGLQLRASAGIHCARQTRPLSGSANYHAARPDLNRVFACAIGKQHCAPDRAKSAVAMKLRWLVKNQAAGGRRLRVRRHDYDSLKWAGPPAARFSSPGPCCRAESPWNVRRNRSAER